MLLCILRDVMHVVWPIGRFNQRVTLESVGLSACHVSENNLAFSRAVVFNLGYAYPWGYAKTS
jgi:hypothetical protein